jgi:hypothetical protein
LSNKKLAAKICIDIIKHSFSALPNRNLAYNLLNLNRQNSFEIAQEITFNIAYDNIEKLWLLLIVAIKLNLISKMKEIIMKLLNFDKSTGLLKFT